MSLSIRVVSRYRDPLVALLLLLLPGAFYLANSKEPRDHTAFDKVIVWVSSPVQWLVVGALDGVTHVWRRYINLVGVATENERLRSENAELRAALAKREEQRQENERLHLLVGLRQRSPEVRTVLGRVISLSPTSLYRAVRIDCGTDDGVFVGSAVVTHDGVVGRVAQVAAGWADVMLLVDANSSTDVVVQRTRARARIRGTGGDGELGIEVEHLARIAEVNPGDVLITSGLGSVFPKGLRVGRIFSVEKAAFGLYQKAKAEPSVDFRRLEEVLVIRKGWPREATFDEGGDWISSPEPRAP